jgi:hypothetical protein
MTRRLKLVVSGLLIIVALLTYVDVRSYQIMVKQKQVITDLIGITLQYDNALRGCQDPVNMPRISTTRIHPR